MVHTRRCTPSKVVTHNWYIVWEDSSGEIRDAVFETGIVGFLHLLERIGNPSSFVHQYLGHS